MKTIRVLWMVAFTFALLTLGAVAPAAAWVPVVDRGELNDSQEPGSVLVFPKFIRGTVSSPDQVNNPTDGLPRSMFQISVVCPADVDCFNTPPDISLVTLKAHWVCPPDAEDETSTCKETDFHLYASVWGTVLFNPENLSNDKSVTGQNRNNVMTPPCKEGYLIAWVVDNDVNDNAIKFDGLIGGAVIRSNDLKVAGAPFALSNSTRSYGAIPIQALSSTSTYDFVLPGTPQGPNGPLVFDGKTQYKAVTGTIYGSLRFANGGPDDSGKGTQDTRLVLLTLDVASNQHNDRTDVGLTFYSEFEESGSTATHFTCWGETELRDLDIHEDNPLFNGSGYGLVKSTSAQQNSHGGVTLLGLIESREELTVSIGMASVSVRRDYTFPLFNDSYPIETTFFPF